MITAHSIRRLRLRPATTAFKPSKAPKAELLALGHWGAPPPRSLSGLLIYIYAFPRSIRGGRELRAHGLIIIEAGWFILYSIYLYPATATGALALALGAGGNIIIPVSVLCAWCLLYINTNARWRTGGEVTGRKEKRAYRSSQLQLERKTGKCACKGQGKPNGFMVFYFFASPGQWRPKFPNPNTGIMYNIVYSIKPMNGNPPNRVSHSAKGKCSA
jgi:hypothetical protein